eukprot:g20551.t1
MKALICSKEAPLRFLLQQLPPPSPPGRSTPEKIPEHMAVSSLLSPDASGQVPFADVAFDVTTGEGGFSRFLAHRVVVASQSSVLLQENRGADGGRRRELSKLPCQELPQEGIQAAVFKVDPRISKDVWRNVLQFLYTGVLQCPFANNPYKMVELFRAAALYKLPKALLDLAQAVLFQELPKCPDGAHLALEVFSITCGSSGEGLEVKSLRTASMMLLLNGAPQVFAEMPPEKLEEACIMPARPPISMGMYDPANYRDNSKMQLVKVSKAEEEMSTTAREVELCLQSTGEVLRLPAQVSTTVWDIKLFLAERLGKEPGDFTFIAKQGPFWRENKDVEEMRRKVIVKGIKSFERERFVHEHPIVVIGAGHIGLRQAVSDRAWRDGSTRGSGHQDGRLDWVSFDSV